jgi:hypothetical protein
MVGVDMDAVGADMAFGAVDTVAVVVHIQFHHLDLDKMVEDGVWELVEEFRVVFADQDWVRLRVYPILR